MTDRQQLWPVQDIPAKGQGKTYFWGAYRPATQTHPRHSLMGSSLGIRLTPLAEHRRRT